MRYADPMLEPHPLLSTTQTTDFHRNFATFEKYAKRPYSLAKVIRELSQQPPRLTGFEMEVDEELRSLTTDRQTMGTLIPMQALCQRDLTSTGFPTVQTSVGEEIAPFLRYKSVTGRLGATLLSDLTGGIWKLPRATATGGASWQTEIANAPTANALFDAITLTPSRISANTVISKQLVAQAQPDIEQFVIDELSAAIATEVDRVVLNGSGVAPQPLGILNLPVNPASTYAYNARSPNITFGGAATWGKVIQFESTIDDYAQAHNDGSYGWVGAPDVKTKWMQAAKVATYPEFLWEQPDDQLDGRIAGRKAVSTSQVPTGTVIFGRWSDALIGTWLGTEILVNPYQLAIQAENVITLNLWIGVAFRYSSAFVTSSDSASQ
jgi:HK97 family phage major capsid protein